MPIPSFDGILTCYNAQDTISQAIESTLDQTIALSNIFVIDDNSTDNSPQILQKYRNRYKQIQLIRNETNVGQSLCRNLGVSRSRSNFVIFFDDDDISFSNRVEAHKLLFEKGADISFVSSTIKYPGNYSRVCTNSDYVGRLEIKELARMLILGESLDTELSLQIPASTSAVSRIAFELIGGFDPKLRRLEDVDLALNFALQNKLFGFSSKNLVSRFATLSNDKGSGIDSEFELLIIDRYSRFLSTSQRQQALIHAQSRKLYFSQKYFSLFIHLLINPRYFFFKFIRSTVAIRRLIHDIQKFLRR